VYVSEFLAYTTSVDESFKEFKVKRIISAILILAALAFGFASCDDGAAGGGRGWDAVGMWKCVRTTYGNGSVSYDQRYIIKSDGTFELYANGKLDWSGTYQYNDQGIELHVEYPRQMISYRKYNPTTKELEHEMPQETRFYAKQ
jgi:predicted small secreted protein